MNTNQSKASSISQFCADHGISRSMFYALRKAGKAPRLLAVGKRRLVSTEAAAEWRKQREEEMVN